MNYYTKQTSVGLITITEEKGFITSLSFGNYKLKKSCSTFPDRNFFSETIKQAFIQLDEYFSGTRKVFDLPLNPKGTKFQQKVWSILLSIPYGETRSYKNIAAQIGDENACRAVGMANNKNKIPIFIPCHRIINADGSLGGYSGGEKIKQILLNLEQNF